MKTLFIPSSNHPKIPVSRCVVWDYSLNPPIKLFTHPAHNMKGTGVSKKGKNYTCSELRTGRNIFTLNKRYYPTRSEAEAAAIKKLDKRSKQDIIEAINSFPVINP